MDAAEEIVSIWLKQKGYFYIPNIRIPRSYGKEIDFLAIKINGGEIDERVHIEVHASVHPLGPLRPWSPAKYNKMLRNERVKLYYIKKYVGPIVEGTGKLKNRCVENMVKQIFSTSNYEKWLILGKIDKKYDTKIELTSEFEKHNVKVFFLEDLLKNIKFTGTPNDRTGRFIQLLAATLSEEAQTNLLRK